MTIKYRLLARAEMHGAIRDPGYIFTLAKGEVGPHRTVVASNHGAQIAERMNADEQLVDLPLYEEVKDDDKPIALADPTAAGLSVEEQLAVKDARIAELEELLREAHEKLQETGRITAPPDLISPANEAPGNVLLASFQVGVG